ncbi:MAG: hypothetical protein KGL39_57445 [Patescibacteria group bacterium]|nr:hypothetical protein [Patescibacteria group bacterium]
MTNLPGLNADWIVNKYLLSVSQNGQQVLAFDPSRFALIFAAVNGNQVILSWGTQDAAPNGIILQSNPPWFNINFRDYPGIIAGPWFARSTSFGASMYIIETLYRPPQGD